ncbi:MAG TPA: hypothetical protein PKY87_11865 [Terricaulis sp.]|nr:hypothetical protein [Terricaulis sp.]
MKRTFAAALAGAVMFAGFTSPALAITGAEAVNHCMSQGASACAFASRPDGSIRISTREGFSLRCATAQSACEALYAPRTLVLAEAPRARE